MSHRKNLIVGLGVVLLTVLGSVSIAEAQGYPPPYYPPPPPPPPPHGVYRSGLVYGFSAGVGAIHINNCLADVCGVAGLLEGHIGGMINPRTALMLEIWGADHPWSSGGSSFETINTFFTGAAQYWVNDIVWIKGGLGVAELRQTVNDYYNSATTGRRPPTSRASHCSAPPASRCSSPTTSRSISSSASATDSTATTATASARRTTA